MFGFALVLAALIGLSLGLLGSGGSIITLPVLVYVAGIPAHQAVGMSLVIVGGTSAVGALLNLRQGAFDLRATTFFALSGVVGALVGAKFTHLVSAPVLLLLFGALMLVVGIRMLRSGEPTAQSQQCRPLRCLATGVAVAQRCEPCNSRHCPVCRGARCRRRGAAFWLVKKIEARLCPFCRAYERVYGRKAHERRPHKDPYLQDTN